MQVQKFSLEKWLLSANADKERGVLSDREIADACEIWVNTLDGKTKAEIIAINGDCHYNEEWFKWVEV